jgi:pimeloyl-ACP methyl ester carboxylesterase
LEGREYPLFAVGIWLAILHVLDDAFVGKQPGTSARDHLFGASVVIAILVGALVLYPRLRAGWRAALAVGLGTLIAAAGAMHVAHTIIDAPERSDFTGILATVAGVLLIALGVVVAWRAPAHPVRSRRWLRRGVVALGALAVGFYVIFPIGAAVYVTHTPREPIDGAFSVPHEDVSFETGDGLTIRGWYAPSRNGAAIVLVHGSGGSRLGPRKNAELLARHGYGVLLYDSRGRGESDGDPNGFDWTWQPDVDAAIDYLKSRPDVREGRIGGVGLSAGAETLIESAARREDLRAVVAEGAGTRAYGDILDIPNSVGKWITLPNTWAMLGAAQVLSGTSHIRSPGDFVGKAPGRVLLITAGHGLGGEYELNPVWAARVDGRVQLWQLPEGKHTASISERPQEYERRVVGFFDRLLLGR